MQEILRSANRKQEQPQQQITLGKEKANWQEWASSYALVITAIVKVVHQCL